MRRTQFSSDARVPCFFSNLFIPTWKQCPANLGDIRQPCQHWLWNLELGVAKPRSRFCRVQLNHWIFFWLVDW